MLPATSPRITYCTGNWLVGGNAKRAPAYYRLDPAELVLCFDVLIHQKTRQAYEAIQSKALAAAERVALISGYSHAEHGWKVFFHEPVEQSIRRLCPSGEVSHVATYRETDLFRVVKLAKQCKS